MSQASSVRVLSVAYSVIVIVAMAYLTYATVQGEHGIVRMIQIEAQEADLRAELAAAEAERAVIANRVDRLRGENPDLDLLGERAMIVLSLMPRDAIALP